MNLTIREQIWDMIHDLTPEEMTKELLDFEGVKRWEDEVKDIVDSIESLAMAMEHRLKLLL